MGEIFKIGNRKPGDLVQRGPYGADENLSGAADKAVVIYKASTNQHESRVLAIADLPALTTAAVGAAFPAWTAYTPVVTPFAGAITTYTASGRWFQVGKIAYVSGAAAVTNNGNGTVFLYATLPNSLTAKGANYSAGRDAGGAMLQVFSQDADNRLIILTYNNGYPTVSGVNWTWIGEVN